METIYTVTAVIALCLMEIISWKDLKDKIESERNYRKGYEYKEEVHE